jgi:hypothetical protein
MAALTDAGPVLEIYGTYYLTRRADVVAPLNNPEVFATLRRPPERCGRGAGVIAG